MRSIRASVCVVAVLVTAAAGAVGAPDATPAAAEAAPKIQVAILLDNSGSMGGLINQARAQLWTFINEFATTRKNGRVPDVQVALYTYGNPPPKQIVPLTDDLDLVSEKLFAVRISGGTEYCGQVIQTAVKNLAWSERNDDLKIIFIAGNEPFTQGPVHYADACKAAIAKGIIVNTIHCGSDAAGVSGKWKDGALLADGAYMCINQNRAVPHIAAPQDKEIATLGVELNTTYIPYGAAGKAGQARQRAQDTNAASVAAEVAVQRAIAKANAQYRNTHWDLLDAVVNGTVKVEDLKKEELPEKMQKMTVEQRVAFVKTNQAARVRIQKRINELNAERKKHVTREMKKLAEKGEDTLDSAMIKTLRAQAARRHFQVAAPAPKPDTPVKTEPKP